MPYLAGADEARPGKGGGGRDKGIGGEGEGGGGSPDLPVRCHIGAFTIVPPI